MHQVNVSDAMIEYESNRLCIDILEYWIAEKPSNWSALGYFITVINTNPTTDKRTAHVNISQNLDNLYTAFIVDSVTKRVVHNIRQSMESKNGREVINEFWNKHTSTLQSLLLLLLFWWSHLPRKLPRVMYLVSYSWSFIPSWKEPYQNQNWRINHFCKQYQQERAICRCCFCQVIEDRFSSFD